jgi:hypothetical protein
VFEGTLKEYTVQPRTGSWAKEGQETVILMFTDIKVIESDEEYGLKTAIIGINFSDSVNGGWVWFEDTIAEAIDVSTDDVCVDMIVGKRMKMTRTDNHLFFKDTKKNTESRGSVWSVSDVKDSEGGSTSAIDEALELLDGKTKAEFTKLAMRDSAIKKDSKISKAILNGSFFDNAEVTSAFDVIDGKYARIA